MAKVTKVAVSYGLTINLGDYSNLKPEVMIEAQLEKGDDEHQVTQDLFAQAKNEVAAMLQDQCIASVGKISLLNANSLDDVEKLFARHSTLFRYIQNLDRKRAVDAIAYPAWTREVERRTEAAARFKATVKFDDNGQDWMDESPDGDQ